MKRDPRVDPKNGDIIRLGGRFNAQYHEVLPHDPRMGINDVSSICDGVESQRSINQWREFAVSAEVIRRVKEVE